MAFDQPLNSSAAAMEIILSSEDEPDLPVKAEDSKVAVKAETAQSSSSTSAITDWPGSEARGHRLHEMWGEHEGFGMCEGSNQLECCFGRGGEPTAASPDGRCDLCSGDNLRALHMNCQSRVTHLLKQLNGKPLQHALIRIKLVLREAAMQDYENRRLRALHRRA